MGSMNLFGHFDFSLIHSSALWIGGGILALLITLKIALRNKS